MKFKTKKAVEKSAPVKSATAPTGKGIAAKLQMNLPSWAETDPRKMNKTINQMTAPKVFAPEIYLADQETKVMRFLSDHPLIQYFRYRIKVGTRWMSFTQPPQGERDLFAEEGHTPSFVALYLVHDKVGYMKKDGTKSGERLAFFLASGKLFKQLEMLTEKRGGISNFDIEITRIGADQTTTYQLIPEVASPISPSVLKLDNPASKINEFYGPLSLEKQAEILGVDL